MTRLRRLLGLYAAYLLGYHVGRVDGHAAAWRSDPSGARRVG